MNAVINENYIEIYDESNALGQKGRARKFWTSLVLPCVITAAFCAIFVVLAATELLSPWIGWAVCGTVTVACMWYVAIKFDSKKTYTARNDFVNQLPTANRVKRKLTFVEVTTDVQKVFDFDAKVLNFGEEAYLLDAECDCPFVGGKTYDVVTVGKLIVAYREVRNERN